MSTVPEITLPPGLQELVDYCEKICVAGCCGMDAFDFSPLHVASFISAARGTISLNDIVEWERELTKAQELTKDLKPDASGYICSVWGMNQCFTRQTFDAFIEELRHSLHMSPEMLLYSDELRRST